MTDNITKKLNRVSQQNAAAKAAAAERYLEASRARLLKILTKKIKTSFIGSLAKFERYFGKLWGHGLHESECSPDQLEWRAIWDVARTEVLNVGNTQLRAMESEVSEYTMSWNSYQATLSPIGDQGTRTNEQQQH